MDNLSIRLIRIVLVSLTEALIYLALAWPIFFAIRHAWQVLERHFLVLKSPRKRRERGFAK